MIQITDLKKTYNGVTVVNIPQLHLAAGESIGLVGNNGAGKTTLFRMILDLVRPTEGEVRLKEANVRKTESWKQYTGSYLDEGFLVDFLTPDEYFRFIGKLHGLSEGDVTQFLGQFADFFNNEITGTNKFIRDLSKGNQKKVGIAAALMGNPDLLILDEPFANLDPSTQIRLKNLLKTLKAEKNMTMFISSHDLNHTIDVCDRIVVLEKGRVVQDSPVYENTMQELEKYFSV
jgi:ABC-2 type transport system ATP-binding protein